MATQGLKAGLIRALLALGVAASCCTLAAAQDVLRFKYDVAGDSKVIILDADTMATWSDGAQRVLLLKGKILIEHGPVHLRAEQAVAWLDQGEYRKTGVQRLEIYAEGNVFVENGTESQTVAKALVRISTRGEIKLRSHNGKVIQQPQPNDPVYLRGLQQRSGQSRLTSPGGIQQAAFKDLAATAARGTAHASESAAKDQVATITTAFFEQGAPSPDSTPPVPHVVPAQFQTTPPASGGVAPANQPPAPDFSGPVVTPPPMVTAPAPQALQPPPNPALPSKPSQLGLPGGTSAPGREFSVVPRTSAGFNYRTFDVGNGETAVVVTGGIILIVRNSDGSGLLDMEADRLVFWTRGNAQEVLSRMRTSQGNGRELEFYLSGNVQIRSKSGKDERLLQADEVYYDVGRNVAVALHADISFQQPGIPDPVHLKTDELLQLNEKTFQGMKAEVFSSKLPSDPGLKIYLSKATLTESTIAKTSIFGTQFINRITGQPETREQRILDGRNVLLKFEDYPFFYWPFVQGDVNDPLGPLESLGFNYNKIFGFQFNSTFNVYNLLGVDPIPHTRWKLDLDYLSERGPAAGSSYEYAFTDIFGLTTNTIGQLRGYAIYDTGTDQLGGPRGPDDHHPDGRGRFLWRNNSQNLPEGFTVQTQISVLSDKNFLEQFFKNEFDTEYNQETFAYVKQQKDNWAWTFLTEVNTRNWVNETEWLPRAEGYLIGQSFFDLFTYNARASAGYARLRTTDVPPPPESITTMPVNSVRLDVGQELSLPFTLGPFRLVPYAALDTAYYSEDLTGNDRGRLYYGGGLRTSIPFTRLYPDVHNELLNLDGINHKIVLSSNYYTAKSDTPFSRLPQLDRLNDDASDQSLRDIKPVEPLYNPQHGLALLTSPVYDPQLYAIRQLVNDRVDTLDTIEVLQADIRQRWQTKRGFLGQEHIVDWMTLDLSGSFFPHSQRDNFGNNFAFLQYDWVWNIGDRTALVSNGWIDPEKNGPRVFDFGAYMNRPDRTNFFLGYREIDTLNSKAVTGAVTYIFSPKYAMTFSATYDFGVNMEVTSVVFTRMGSDVQLSLGVSYNSILSTFGVQFELVPNIVPLNKRVPPGAAGIGSGLVR